MTKTINDFAVTFIFHKQKGGRHKLKFEQLTNNNKITEAKSFATGLRSATTDSWIQNTNTGQALYVESNFLEMFLQMEKKN